MINLLEMIPGITQYILKISYSRIIANFHLELFSVNAKWGNVCFNCLVKKPVRWLSEIKIARPILGFENFAINYSIS